MLTKDKAKTIKIYMEECAGIEWDWIDASDIGITFDDMDSYDEYISECIDKLPEEEPC